MRSYFVPHVSNYAMLLGPHVFNFTTYLGPAYDLRPVQLGRAAVGMLGMMRSAFS